MNITRRNWLLSGAGAAALTAATVVPLAVKATGVKAALAGDPVIGLVAQFKAAHLAHIEAHEAYEAAAYDAGYNNLADYPATTGTTTNGEQYHWGREEILEAAERDETWHVRIAPEERNRALAAIDAQQREAARVRRELGLDPLKDHAEQCRAHWRDLEAQMLDTPARTVAGVLAKVQSWYGDSEIEDMRGGGEPDQDMQPDLVASIYRDLERLAGEAQS